MNALNASASSRLFAAALCVLAVACDGSAGADDGRPTAEPEELVVFVYDRSASISDFQLERARELTDQRIEEMGYGDRIAALEVLQRSLSEPPRRWTQRVPEREFEDSQVRRDSISKARFLRDAQDYLRQYTDPEDRGNIRFTDILATLHDVGSEVQAYDDYRAIVYLFSDMLQSDGAIEMEGGRSMPSGDWVQTRDRQGRLPDLEGACIMVVGARTDTRMGQRVKDFWSEYFEATGAELLDRNYTYRPVRLPPHPCSEEGTARRSGDSGS